MSSFGCWESLLPQRDSKIEKRTSNINPVKKGGIWEICALGGVRFHVFMLVVVQMWYRPGSQAIESLAALGLQPITNIILRESGERWRVMTSAWIPAIWESAVPWSWSRPWSPIRNIPFPAPRSLIPPDPTISCKHCSPRDTGQFNITDSSVCLTSMKRNFWEIFSIFCVKQAGVFL